MEFPKLKEYMHIYKITTNSELTEGRGHDIVLALTFSETTAKRLAKGKYVQGTDCPIERVELIEIEDFYYIKVDSVPIHIPSESDNKTDKLLEEKEKIMFSLETVGKDRKLLESLLERYRNIVLTIEKLKEVK